MAIKTEGRPLLTFEQVRAYLAERDRGAPTVSPTPIDITRTDLGVGWRYDLIRWTYTPPPPPSINIASGVAADGFVVYWALTSTADPTENGVLISLSQRTFGLMVPADTPASYAVAAVRYTHIGEQTGRKATIPAWVW